MSLRGTCHQSDPTSHPPAYCPIPDRPSPKTEIGVAFVLQPGTNNTIPAIITQNAGLGPNPFLRFGRSSRVFMLSYFLGWAELGDVTYFECLFLPSRSAGARPQWTGPQHYNNDFPLGDVTGILHLGTHDPARHKGRSVEEILMGGNRLSRKKDQYTWVVEALRQLRQPIVAERLSLPPTDDEGIPKRKATPGMADLTVNHCLKNFGKMLSADFVTYPLIPLCSIKPRNVTPQVVYFEGGRFLEFQVWFWTAIEPTEE